jgi:hypothetical protein
VRKIHRRKCHIRTISLSQECEKLRGVWGVGPPITSLAWLYIISHLETKFAHSKLLQGLVLIGGFEWSKELNVSVERGTRSLNDDEWNELLKKLIAKGYEVDEKRQDLW